MERSLIDFVKRFIRFTGNKNLINGESPWPDERETARREATIPMPFQFLFRKDYLEELLFVLIESILRIFVYSALKDTSCKECTS